MKSLDLTNRNAAREKLQQALRDNNTDAFYSAFDELIECIGADVMRQAEARLAEAQQAADSRVLANRGVRQLTSKERTYYQKLADAMRASDPKQALAAADLVMPETTINSVFDDLQTNHPLLSHIDFMPTGGALKILMSVNGYQTAQWGKLCSEIVKEMAAGFKEYDTTLNKLTAFLPVCKAMLELGPEWLDNFIRQVLYEAISNGLEQGIVDGDGNDKPIGMTRDVGAGVAVINGSYPRKTAIVVKSFDPKTMGGLAALLAVDESGKPRVLTDFILTVNPQDYYQLVMPATTLLEPDGTYRRDVFPLPLTVIQSVALQRGEAVFGDARRYFAFAGTAPHGRIEYDDSVRFLEDERVYLAKVYANGLPKDNNSFLLLDISGLEPVAYRVVTVNPPEPSKDAALSSLRIGSLTLSPAFEAKTTAYTATTTNATNTVTAIPSDAGATVGIKLGDKPVDNGAAVTWAAGENVLTVTVTAADGNTATTYTVTVTKSNA